MWFHVWAMSTRGKSIDAEGRAAAAWAWGGIRALGCDGHWVRSLSGIKTFLFDKNILKSYFGGGCTILWVHQTPLSCTVQLDGLSDMWTVSQKSCSQLWVHADSPHSLSLLDRSPFIQSPLEFRALFPTIFLMCLFFSFLISETYYVLEIWIYWFFSFISLVLYNFWMFKRFYFYFCQFQWQVTHI